MGKFHIIYFTYLLIIFPRLHSKRFPRLRTTSTEPPIIIDETPEAIAKSYEAPLVVHATTNHTATLIFLHSLGGTGDKLESTMQRFQVPYMKIICPTANRMPLLWKRGFYLTCWYDINNVVEDEVGIRRATIYISDMIDKEIANGIRPERIIVGGFAQGGTLARHIVNLYPKKLGGFMAFTMWRELDLSNKTLSKANHDIPVFESHDCGVDTEYVYRHGFKSFTGAQYPLHKYLLDSVHEFFNNYTPEVEVINLGQLYDSTILFNKTTANNTN